MRSELYRALRMKSTYILLACMLAVVLMTTFILTTVNYSSFVTVSDDQLQEMNEGGFSLDALEAGMQVGQEAGANSYYYQEQSAEGGNVDIELYGMGLFYDADLSRLFEENAKGMYDALMSVIFIALFIGSAYKVGFDKNLIMANTNRSLLALARFCVVALYDALLLLVMFLSTLLSDVLFTGSVSMTWDGRFVRYFIATYFLLLSFSAVVMTITTVTRSVIAGNTIGIFMSCGTVSFACAIADHILINYFGVSGDFRLVNFTLSQNITVLGTASDDKVFTRAVICGLVYLILSIVSSYIVTEKRDIN